MAALVLAAVIALFVVIGLFLPRQWTVEVTTVTKATPAQVMPLVRDFREWMKWTTAMPDTTYSYSDRQGQVGSWMSWSGRGSRAKLIVTEVSDQRMKFDEQMEADEVNAHGEISAAPDPKGTRITWRDTGTLPPILGGYFRGMMENALTEHMKGGLAKLSVLAESSTPPVAPTAGDDLAAADAGSIAQVEEVVVDAGAAAETADAGAVEIEADAGAHAEADAGAAP